jgi:hypothetical protein
VKDKYKVDPYSLRQQSRPNKSTNDLNSISVWFMVKTETIDSIDFLCNATESKAPFSQLFWLFVCLFFFKL